MPKYIAIAASVALFLAAGTSAAFASTQGYYFSGLGGASWMPSLGFVDGAGHSKTTFDTGYVIGGALGYDTGTGWRYELDSVYQMSGLSRFNGAAAPGHLRSTSLMLNTTYDLFPNEPFTPYVGAGVGVQEVGGSVNGMRGDDWKPAYQLEAGLRHDLTQDTSIFAEYRFSQSDAVRLTSAIDTGNQHFSDHMLLAGISIHLGQ